MQICRNAACLLSALTVWLVPAAQAQSDEAGATAHRLMVRSGLSVQLRGYAAQIENEIKQNPAKLDGQLIAALGAAAREAFRAELLQEDMTRRIAKKLTVADMKTALAWLETPLGRRITLAEELASAALDERSLRAYLEHLKATPLPEKRKGLIAELVSVTHAVRAAAATQEAMALGVALGMDSMQPRERRVGEAELRARLRQALPPDQVQAALAQQLPLVYAYTYRDLPDADLSAYAAFLKSVGGKRYHDGMTGAFIEGLGRASLQVGELAAQRHRKTAL